MHTGLETDDVTHTMCVHYERQTFVASSNKGKIFVSPRVHNIIEEESILLSISLYKRVLQSISVFHRLLP